MGEPAASCYSVEAHADDVALLQSLDVRFVKARPGAFDTVSMYMRVYVDLCGDLVWTYYVHQLQMTTRQSSACGAQA